MENIFWKDQLSQMKKGDRISASLRWQDNEGTRQKRLRKFRKLGYLKYLGCTGNSVVYERTGKEIDESHFKR